VLHPTKAGYFDGHLEEHALVVRSPPPRPHSPEINNNPGLDYGESAARDVSSICGTSDVKEPETKLKALKFKLASQRWSPGHESSNAQMLLAGIKRIRDNYSSSVQKRSKSGQWHQVEPVVAPIPHNIQNMFNNMAAEVEKLK
jgi:hypothetical protein